MGALGVLAIALITGSGCGRTTPSEALADAEQRLTSGDWDGAVEVATEGLALTGGENGVRLRLGLVKVEALARAKHGSDARVALERLAEAYPAHVTAAHFLDTATRLEASGDGAAAATVLAAGLRRFPTDPELVARSEAAREVAVADDLPITPVAEEAAGEGATIPAPTAVDPDPMAAPPRPRRPTPSPAAEPAALAAEPAAEPAPAPPPEPAAPPPEPAAPEPAPSP